MANVIDSLSFDNVKYSLTLPYGSCSTAAATAAKAVTVNNFDLDTGSRIAVKFTVTNTASNPTLNVNSTGAKAIYYRGSAITAGYLASGRTYEFVYNGTQWEVVGDINTDSDKKASSGNSSSKLFLIGTTSQSSSGETTYSHDTAYVGTDGCLYSNSTKVSVEGHTHDYAASGHTHNYAGSSSAGGSATSAVKLDSDAGSATQPVYFSGGKPIACTYYVNKTVPANAVFTDTTYSNMSAATSSAAGKAGLVPAPAAGAQSKFLRGDGTWQTPTNTTYSNMTAATSSAAGKAGLVPAPAAGKQSSFLRGDGSWATPTNTTYSAASGGGLSLSSTAFSVNTTFTSSGKNYAIKVDATTGGLYVNVPWTDTDTKYTHPSSHAASMITGLATVATSGSYNDLTNKPSIPSGAAASKGVDTSISAASTSTNLPTSKAVAAFVEGKGYKTTDNNTTYTIATGDSNGQIKVTPSSGSAYNVSVKGLGTSAYYSYGTFALASHGTHVSASTVKSALGTGTGTTKYLREDGTWATPPDTNTVYTLPNATSSTLGGVKVGSNITVSSGTISLTKANVTAALGYTPPTSDTNTTYSAGTGIILSGTTFSLNTGYYATSTQNGLMSAADKAKLDGIASGANKYTHPSTHAASMITGLATVATSGSYNDLSNKPTILTLGTTATTAAKGNHTHSGYVSKSDTGVQSISGGLVVGGTSAAATEKGRIMVTGNINPLVGLQAIDGNGNQLTPFYVQVSNDVLYVGPTSTLALSFDSSGNVASPANFSIGGTISEGGTALSSKYASKSAASQSAAGLMSAADKKKLDGIATGATATSDTKNTAGSTNSTSKIYLVGCLGQGPYYQTFSNSKCYASGGYLYSNGTKVSVEGHTHSYMSASPTSITIAGTATNLFTIKNNTTNKFRVANNGGVYGSKYYTSGADYSEYMEWQDKNLDAEDRRGYFVTVDDCETIRIANSEDDVIGVVSSTPSVIGNDATFHWSKQYLTDIYGETLFEEIEYPETIDEEGNVIPAHTEMEPIINPEYDPTREYIPRNQRPEWAAIGMLGQLVVRDDGTCKAGKYCKCNDDGIATLAEGRNGWRILKRLDEHHIKILFR